jgi:hypothetical protein
MHMDIYGVSVKPRVGSVASYGVTFIKGMFSRGFLAIWLPMLIRSVSHAETDTRKLLGECLTRKFLSVFNC